MYAGPATKTHSLVFNKFNLVDNHLVIVTNDFESQYDPVTRADLEAAWRCVVDLAGLSFFNGGRLAGASQPHKHLQFVPTPIVSGSSLGLPIESALLGPHVDSSRLDPFVNHGLPFYNLFAMLPQDLPFNDAVSHIYKTYTQMMSLAEPIYKQHGIEKPWCFNFLLMHNWMLLVPRSLECVEDTSISVNSMGFAGTIFVKSTEHLDKVKTLGPMKVLSLLCLPLNLNNASL